MNYFDAAILGLVEGLTEFLPVSSTGHLILAGEALGLAGAKVGTFEVFIQIGAMFAVILCYFSRFWGLLVPDKNKAFSGPRGIGLLLLTTFPGAFLGLLAHDAIKSLFTPASVSLALAVGAVCMLLTERLSPRLPGHARNLLHRASKPNDSVDALDARAALGIGLFQCLALWPGFSRSAATIMGGMLLGLDRQTAAEYSFLAAVPIIVGAAGYDLLKSWGALSMGDLPLFAVGTLAAFCSALLAIKTFISILSRVGLSPFAWYRLLLVIPVYWFMVR